MRWSDSARLVSGNLPMSSAEMPSTTPDALRLRSIERSSDARTPVTTISLSAVCGVSWAATLVALPKHTARVSADAVRASAGDNRSRCISIPPHNRADNRHETRVFCPTRDVSANKVPRALSIAQLYEFSSVAPTPQQCPHGVEKSLAYMLNAMVADPAYPRSRLPVRVTICPAA